ncbi:MAG: phosphoenolpyruvate carboxykinase (ATP) [Bacteroidota bacterium]|nr:phosphoenolpyruvate carboxykinase (ATP) [Bacteroidota bacterium]
MTDDLFSLEYLGISNSNVSRNLSRAKLYQEAILYDEGAAISNVGGLMLRSGEKTGRSPKDKRVVKVEGLTDDVWWGKVNIPLKPGNYDINRERAIDYFNAVKRLYVFDGFAGWDPEYRLKVRVICTRPYHALFMQNMLIRPTDEELTSFGRPDFTIMNAGKFPANRHTEQMSSKTSIDLNFEQNELTILGTEYAGEMKKGVFSVMHYLMPKRGVLSMHCSANEGDDGDVSLFFGLSGTGKTTLSADPNRHLIGDDEHCWSNDGVFNIEGGCYAKAIGLSPESEPEIFNAIRFGSVLENVVYDEQSHIVDFNDTSITQNTRVAYPIDFIDNAKIPCVGSHPKNIIFLTYDAFGVLPPISKLTSAQAMYHFISGYTAKVAGTEMGVDEPQATFSACFGDAFLVLHPARYAEMLAEKMQRHGAKAWLINTGMTGGAYGTGKRMSLKHTRAIIDAIHEGSLDSVDTVEDPVFGVAVPTDVPNVPSEVLIPRDTWADQAVYDATAQKLANLFNKNFEQYREGSSDEIAAAGPKV